MAYGLFLVEQNLKNFKSESSKDLKPNFNDLWKCCYKWHLEIPLELKHVVWINDLNQLK